MALTFCCRNIPDIELEVVGTKSRRSELDGGLLTWPPSCSRHISILGIPATRDVKSHATVRQAIFFSIIRQNSGSFDFY